MGDVYIRQVDLNSWIAKYFEKQELISVDDLIGCIEDLDGEIEKLQERIQNLQEDIQENYKPISKSEMYDAWYSLTQFISIESVGLEKENISQLLGTVNVGIRWNSYKESQRHATTAGD